MTSQADKQRLLNAGRLFWEAFTARGGRMSMKDARVLAVACGYGVQVIASLIRWRWLKKDGADLVFTQRHWNWLGGIYGKHRLSRW